MSIAGKKIGAITLTRCSWSKFSHPFFDVFFLCFVDTLLLREDLADLMPMVNEANAISQELDKKVTHYLHAVAWCICQTSRLPK